MFGTRTDWNCEETLVGVCQFTAGSVAEGGILEMVLAGNWLGATGWECSQLLCQELRDGVNDSYGIENVLTRFGFSKVDGCIVVSALAIFEEPGQNRSELPWKLTRMDEFLIEHADNLSM